MGRNVTKSEGRAACPHNAAGETTANTKQQRMEWAWGSVSNIDYEVVSRVKLLNVYKYDMPHVDGTSTLQIVKKRVIMKQ